MYATDGLKDGEDGWMREREGERRERRKTPEGETHAALLAESTYVRAFFEHAMFRRDAIPKNTHSPSAQLRISGPPLFKERKTLGFLVHKKRIGE